MTVETWQRYKTIYEAHQSGMTYRDIGEKFDVSPQRACQMMHKWELLLRVTKQGYAKNAGEYPVFQMSQELVAVGLLGTTEK